MTSPKAQPTSRPVLVILLLIAVTAPIPALVPDVLAQPDARPAATDTHAGSDLVADAAHFVASVLDWLGFGGDETDAGDDSEEAPPLPSMGFEIEPNG